MKIQLTAVILVNFLPKQLFLLFSRFWPIKSQVVDKNQIFLAHLLATGPLWGLIALKLAGSPIGLKKMVSKWENHESDAMVQNRFGRTLDLTSDCFFLDHLW